MISLVSDPGVYLIHDNCDILKSQGMILLFT